MNIQVGSLTDFFESAQETARELDRGEKLTPKHRIWIDPGDFARLVKPERVKLIRYLRGKERVVFSDLVVAMHRPAESINKDLHILSKYHLVHISKERDDGRGLRKVIKPTFGSQQIEFKIEI
jgi:predicted transcriptional regulator